MSWSDKLSPVLASVRMLVLGLHVGSITLQSVDDSASSVVCLLILVYFLQVRNFKCISVVNAAEVCSCFEFLRKCGMVIKWLLAIVILRR